MVVDNHLPQPRGLIRLRTRARDAVPAGGKPHY